ncbi:class I SAM-dependent methyltransferase [Aureitalea sp. L0-47]|uniref:THUMP-like domain-containing protein n=1 Tax=Aureitalea sp. L0-47 TaxID=2816962 RepID=UPI0022375905|nr:methyltransferase [Aureitalea sp. L0-47]MCW5519341.1 class I SAM-dependent methyltransferase [Aureitalea sp. L0-47]
MNTAILKPEVQQFIREFEGDITKLAFAGSPFAEISTQELLEQIDSREKIRNKLPVWYSTSNIYYPPKLNLEQTSSERTAKYKSELCDGSVMADITGGFGVDSYYFSERFKGVDHFEQQEKLSEIAKHNFRALGVENVHCHNEDGLKGLRDKQYDLIYVDPSRRTNEKRKVFLLEDCTPNIISNIEYLLTHTKLLMVKTSPMLDISIGIKSLKKVKEIHVVALNNEVKELLWLLTSDDVVSPKVATVNLLAKNRETFDFVYGSQDESKFGDPASFLYEPNSAILKSGGFSMISEVFGIEKLHKHSHLYTSNELIDFPGRRFRIKKIVPYNKKNIKTAIDFKKANVTVRNFPESVESLRKKWKINEGGDLYLFFTTGIDDRKIMLVCEKITNKLG